MNTKVIASFLVVSLAGSVAAQTLPSFLTKTGTYTAAQLFGGTKWGAGGIHFDPTGTYLYVTEINNGHVTRLTVVRTNGKITGFTARTRVMTSVTTGWLDGGLTLSRIGTLMAVGYNPADLEQISFATKAQTLINLTTTANLTGSTGSCDFLPRTATSKERFLVSDYINGGIYEIPLTLQTNLTYTVGTAKLYMRTPGAASGSNGVEGFAVVPTGPFGNGKGLVYANYRTGTVYLVALDPTTMNPFTDAKGNPMVIPLIAGIYAPMDVEFDPLTGDMFVSDYGSSTIQVALLQYSGTILGGFNGEFEQYGAGCPQKNGQVPTLSANAKLVSGSPITFVMTNAPRSMPTSFLVFGAGSTGNLGGFLFPGTTCRVYANPMLSIPFGTNNQGVASFQFTIPSSAKGLPIFVQAWALALQANVLNLTVSDAYSSVLK